MLLLCSTLCWSQRCQQRIEQRGNIAREKYSNYCLLFLEFCDGLLGLFGCLVFFAWIWLLIMIFAMYDVHPLVRIMIFAMYDVHPLVQETPILFQYIKKKQYSTGSTYVGIIKYNI